MSGFIEIQHDEWVAATPDVARAHYSDLNHRDVARVHPRERLRQLPPGPTGPRFERAVRARWHTVRDIYERQDRPDGSVLDRCVGGAHWGRAVVARFYRSVDDGRVGTLIELTLTQPLRPVLVPPCSSAPCRSTIDGSPEVSTPAIEVAPVSSNSAAAACAMLAFDSWNWSRAWFSRSRTWDSRDCAADSCWLA